MRFVSPGNLSKGFDFSLMLEGFLEFGDTGSKFVVELGLVGNELLD